MKRAAAATLPFDVCRLFLPDRNFAAAPLHFRDIYDAFVLVVHHADHFIGRRTFFYFFVLHANAGSVGNAEQILLVADQVIVGSEAQVSSGAVAHERCEWLLHLLFGRAEREKSSRGGDC